MSLIPAFEIGVWNAWIFMAFMLLSMIPFIFVGVKKNLPFVKELKLSRIGKIFANSSKPLLFPLAVYSIFLPLKLGTAWFYVGLPITLIGAVAYTVVLINWLITPLESQVSRGLYRYSRHPMYLSMFVFMFGLAILTASWIVLLFFIVLLVGCVVYTNDEERGCLAKWGETYRGYVARTPKWLGIPKSE
jgi:protein-S-isoprenylcysteine O-methyltransferase Ste14